MSNAFTNNSVYDWDSVPDDELEETLLERIEGLKEMFPEKLRNGASSSVNWAWWMFKETFSLTKTIVWVISTTSLVMVMPYFIEKELYNAEKMQVKTQQQLLLGSSIKPSKKNN